MKLVADLGKITDNKNALIIEKGERFEYVIASNFDPNAKMGEAWSHGDYYSDFLSFIKGVEKTAYGIDFEDVLYKFQSYVENDFEAADPGYIRETLETVGIDKDNADTFGFENMFDDRDIEMEE